MFLILLTNIVSTSDHTKCILLSNHKCVTQHSVINLNSIAYSQKLRYYQFSVNLDKYAWSYNTLDDLSSRICVPNETEDLNWHVFNMITRINQSKALMKHISCKCECIFHNKKCNSNQKWNGDKCRCECKNSKEYFVCEKIIFGIVQYVVAKMINM